MLQIQERCSVCMPYFPDSEIMLALSFTFFCLSFQSVYSLLLWSHSDTLTHTQIDGWIQIHSI